jgi:hypothetical protein
MGLEQANHGEIVESDTSRHTRDRAVYSYQTVWIKCSADRVDTSSDVEYLPAQIGLREYMIAPKLFISVPPERAISHNARHASSVSSQIRHRSIKCLVTALA